MSPFGLGFPLTDTEMWDGSMAMEGYEQVYIGFL